MKSKSTPLVSIVMPFYNVEAYVEASIRSVFAQTYPCLELLAVDDCGTDGSRGIVEELAECHPDNVTVSILTHPKNRGLAAARNTGVDAAKGKYVFFLDSDDRITPNCIMLLAERAEQTNAQMVVGGYRNVGADLQLGDQLGVDHDCVIKGHRNIVEAYCSRYFYMMAWNKLVRTDFLRTSGSAFIEGIVHEDNPWSMQMALALERMVIVTHPTYLYNIRPGSISTNGKLERRRQGWAKGLSAYYDTVRKHPECWDIHAVYDYFTSETLEYFRFVSKHFPIKTLWRELAKVNDFSYPSKYSTLHKGLPPTHILYNFMVRSPRWLRFVMAKTLFAIR